MSKSLQRLIIVFYFIVNALVANAQGSKIREKILLDSGWHFALGHAFDTAKDFENGTGYFSYFTKTGYGDGAASASFDDRSWRKLNLPHDWAVEQDFDSKGSLSHGFKAVGRNFPQNSVGWYRKTIHVSNEDLGRKLLISFDGISRDAKVWINGHYLGNEPSGYLSFEYDISDYINYGGDNVIAVRADVTMEEGWFYEGAGIYRHVWLKKMDPLHITTNGTFITSAIQDSKATLNAQVSIKNEYQKPCEFIIDQVILDANGKAISSSKSALLKLSPMEEHNFSSLMSIDNPKLWSLESPYLHKMITNISKDGTIVDTYTTMFGIRSIRFDPNTGFFLNGQHIKIKGTNNHQDHAGVGIALPDALQYFRIKTLKDMGSNAYRCSHHPPTPELLEACDRLGMLVIDENRLMGTNEINLNAVKRMIIRDRNHPSIISWSIGNEEWGIEGSVTGARIAKTMQDFVKTIDTTRSITAAISGGIGYGISTTIDNLGYNYIATKNTDEQHKKFPKQLSWGTEEGSTLATRGIYFVDPKKQYLVAYDRPQNEFFTTLEKGWKHFATRPYLAGMFIWTGFDYRGEPVPFGWPSVTSNFGMLDLCGFPKDNVWYLKSWWTEERTLHIFPHWNWKGREGEIINVCAYSNCDEVELFLNKKSLGKKQMETNGHLEWDVRYMPGQLEAIGYKDGKRVKTDVVKTTEKTTGLVINKAQIPILEADLAVISIKGVDKNGIMVPTADNELSFEITGPGKMIGVGNGDPTSLEPEKYIEKITTVPIENFKELAVETLEATEKISPKFDDSKWKKAFNSDRNKDFGEKVKALVYRGTVMLPYLEKGAKYTYYFKTIGKQQSIYINGKQIAVNLGDDKKFYEFTLDTSMLNVGLNSIAIIAAPLLKKNNWDSVNSDPGLIQITSPAKQWKRKLFNGLAQVIIQSNGDPGEITLTTISGDLKGSKYKFNLKR